jgi:hypothetical protein
MLCTFFYAGAFICACYSLGRHIVALEEDKELFSALLVSMVRISAASSTPQPQVLQGLKILMLWRLFQPR